MTPRHPLQLLGTPSIHLAEGRQHLLPPKDALLLAMLALDGALSREQAASRLWPLNTPASARANLRQRLRKLQSLGATPLLVDDGSSLALALDSDLQHLAALVKDDPQAARGDLLGSLKLDDDEGTALWLHSARQRVHHQRNAALLSHIDALAAQNQEDASRPWLHRLIEDNPADETLGRRWMQWHHRRGDHGAAAQAFALLKAHLQQLHGAQPSPETAALAEWMARATAAATSPRAELGVAHAALQRPPLLLEREEAWAQLQQTWHEGGIALVVAEAGTGKTRLLADFADQVGLGLRLRAQAGDAGVPGALLARWVASRSQAAQNLPDWARQALSSLYPGLLPQTSGEPAPPLRLSQALQLLARQDQALWIDDLHHADHASLALLPAALEGLRCGLLSLRGPQLPEPLKRWLAHQPQEVHRLSLKPWSAEAVQRLLQQLPMRFDQTQAWAESLWRHCGGRPSWTLQTLKASLPVAPAPDGGWPPPSTWPTPATVSEGLSQRLAQLSPAAVTLLQMVCLAGEDFTPELAANLHEQPLPSLASPWAELQQAHLVTEAGQAAGLVSATLASTMSTPLKQALHKTLAQALSARGVAPERLAQHWTAAAQPAQAAACHEAAAQAQGQRSMRSAQIHHWAQAAQCWQQAGEAEAAFNASAEQAELLLTAGQPSDCLALCDQLEPLANNAQQWANCWRLRAWGLAYRREFAAAMTAVDTAWPAAQAAGRPSWQSEVLGLKVSLAGLLGQKALAEQALAQAQAMVLPADDWLLQMNHQSRIADGLLYLERLPQALQAYERGLVLSQRPEARTERISLLGNTALVQFRLGLGAAALRSMRESVPLADSCGQLQGQVGGQALMQAALLEAAHGHYSQALALAERSLAVLAPLNVPVVLALAESHLAWIWMCMGQSARALQRLRSPLEQASPLVQLRRWTLGMDLHRLCGTSAPGQPPQAWEQCEDAAVLFSARMAQAQTLPPEQAANTLAQLADELQTRGAVSQHLQARTLCLRALTETAPAEAAHQALALLADLQHAQPLGMHWPEVLWLLHQALRAGGHNDAAAEQLALARAWIQQSASELPGSLRDAFLNRQRVHVAALHASSTR